MAPVNTISVLAFATAALAAPYHGHGHAKYHNNKPSGFSAYPYPSANGTGIYATGTGFASGTGLSTGAPIAPASESVIVSDVETTTAVAAAYTDAASSCASDVTVTTVVQVTVTVGESSPASASSTSSEAAPVEFSTKSSAPAYSAPASSEAAPVYSAAPSYSSKAEPMPQQTQSSSAAYSSSSPVSSVASVTEQSSSAVSPVMTYSAAGKGVGINIGYGESSSSSSMQAYSSSSSSSAAPSSSAPSSYGSSSSSGKTGKRGVAYNDAKLAECLTESPAVSWGYNWGSSSSGLSSNVKYIPTLWGTSSSFTGSWSDNAKSAIASGSTHLFSFNEPDLSEQANMSPSDAAAAYKTYMEPFAGKAKLCAPSVTNGGGSMGLSWLSSFLEACSDCTIDCINIHWYDSAENVEYFKKHINDAATTAPGKEIFLSEFGATGSDDQISTFLETVMPWMDDNDSVGGYAYFMASEGKLVSGGQQSAIGKTFAS